MSTAITAGTGATPSSLSHDGSQVVKWDATGITTGVNKAAVSQMPVLGTAVATTSGTLFDFTGIPSWVKRVTVMLNGVSTNGTSLLRFQIGSGSIVSSGYTGTATYIGSAVGGADSTAGFDSNGDNAAAHVRSGTLVFTLVGSNTWILTGSYRYTSGFAVLFYGVSPALSGALDRVRLTTVNGTDTFDLGSWNVLYE